MNAGWKLEDFLSALSDLEQGTLQVDKQRQMADQIRLAMQEAMALEQPLQAFFQLEQQVQTQQKELGMIESVKALVDAGETVQKACQKIAIQYKTSVFKVTKAYNAEFGKESTLDG